MDANDLQQSQDVSKRKRDDSQPTSSSRNRSRRNITKKSTRIDKGVRAKVQRCTLLRVLPRDDQKEVMGINDGNSRNCYGRDISGSYNQGCNIKFNESSVGFKTVIVRKRDRIIVPDDSKEESTRVRDLN